MLTHWVFTSQIFKKFCQTFRNLLAILFLNAIVLSKFINSVISYLKATNDGNSSFFQTSVYMIYGKYMNAV